jgi:hypothetical protein
MTENVGPYVVKKDAKGRWCVSVVGQVLCRYRTREKALTDAILRLKDTNEMLREVFGLDTHH